MHCRILRYLSVPAFVVFILTATSLSLADDNLPEDLTSIGLAQLLELDLTVTSASKKEQNLFDVPAAIYVITNEDIRRSGAVNIAEALRLAPGMHVGQLNSNTWGISSRGFNSEFANTMLVMIDGRSVYSPLFSGVFWDVQNIMMQDIDRIEVIRGPGGTIWGANAVNGVINIITKSSKDTQGALISGGGGNQQRGFTDLRYGAKVGESTNYRIFGQYFDRARSEPLSQGESYPVPNPGSNPGSDPNPDQVDENRFPSEAYDAWHMFNGGFQIDSDITDSDQLMLQGQMYYGEKEELATEPITESPYKRKFKNHAPLSGGHILARWEQKISENSNLQLQSYYDRTVRKLALAEVDIDTFDIDLTHSFVAGKRHHLNWGLNYRVISDDFDSITGTLSVAPTKQTNSLKSIFVQDDISLLPDLTLTVGSKLEHNDYTGAEFQPSARLLWKASEKQSYWLAVSRAVRTPSRIEDAAMFIRDVFSVDDQVLFGTVMGNSDLDSEELIAYEAGWRWQPNHSIFLDLSAFYNTYDKLVGLKMGEATYVLTPEPRIELPLIVENCLSGDTYGTELALHWSATPDWTLSGSYSLLVKDLKQTEGSSDFSTYNMDPKHIAQLHSHLDLPFDVEWDAIGYYVDHLDSNDISSYVRFDTRIGWRITESLELEVLGHNLTDSSHQEFADAIYPFGTSEVKRSIFGRVTVTF